MLAQSNPVAPAINQLGLDLLRALPAEQLQGNPLLSPYSIETALALAYVGADARTREEMRRVLHLPTDDAAALAGFSTLQVQLVAVCEQSKQRAEHGKHYGEILPPIELNIANRVFAQSGFALNSAFTATLREHFNSDLVSLDFRRQVEPSRMRINDWVGHETRDKIRDLIPAGGVTADTRAVLANALYLRAPWESPFMERLTSPQTFWAGGATEQRVPSMVKRAHFGFAKRAGHTAISLPYAGGGLQLLILLPDDRTGLAALRQHATANLLVEGAHLPSREIVLHLPKFKIAGPTVRLGDLLAKLGMPTAFDRPLGSADFSRMAPRTPQDYLCFSEVFHKTFLELDEKGTEAAAATAIAMRAGAAMGPKTPPPEVHIDHPFLFAIQHVESGACLFLGCVNDPR